MFEDSTFESTGQIRTGSPRWMLATFTLNSTIVLALVIIPLVYPHAIPRIANIVPLVAPMPPAELPKPVHLPSGAVIVQRQFDIATFTAPSKIPQQIKYSGVPEYVGGPVDLSSTDTTGGNGSPDNPFGNVRHVQVVEAKPKGPTAVSSGVMAGLLVNQVVPNYPAIPKAMHMEGTVVLAATISKTGRIENLHVVSGSPLFAQAAMDAVAQWAYRPYLLNGQPVEVETTVNVVFKLE